MSKKHRQRLTYEQLTILEVEFLKKSDWSDHGHLSRIAKRLGLTKSKIYKWNWDRKKKGRDSNQYIIACNYVADLNEHQHQQNNINEK